MTAVPSDTAAVHADVQPSSMKRDPVLIGLWIALVLVALVWVAPFIFIVFTSLKTPAAVTSTGAFMPPTELAYDNYSAAWSRGNFANSFLNSVIISGGAKGGRGRMAAHIASGAVLPQSLRGETEPAPVMAASKVVWK